MTLTLRRSRAGFLILLTGSFATAGLFVALADRFDLLKVMWVFLIAVLGSVVLLSPRLGVPLVAFAVPFPFYSDRLSRFVGSDELLVLAISSVWTGLLLASGRSLDTRLFRVPVTLFLVGASIAAIGAHDHAIAFATLGRWIGAFGWMWVLYSWVETEDDIRLLADVLLAALGLVCLLGLFQFLGGPINVPQYTPGRIDSTFGYTNVLGSYLLVSILFVGSVILSESRSGLGLWLRVGVLGMALLALLLTFSRGAVLGLLGGLLVGALLLPYRRRIVGLAAIVVLVVGMTALLLPAVRSQLIQRFVVLGYAETESPRAVTWLAALDALPHTSPLGIGFGNFPELLRHLPLGALLPQILYHPHNLWLAVYFETGILGLIGFGALMVGALWRSARLARRDTLLTSGLGVGAFAALVGLCIHLLADYTIYEFPMILTFVTVLALVGAAEKLSPRTAV